MQRIEKIEAIKNGKAIKLVDIIVISLLAGVIVLGCYFIFWSPSTDTSGASVSVYIEGERKGYFNINRDAEYVFPNGSITLIILNKEVFVVNAACPDKLCERVKINRVNQKIVCLPQEIVIRITGGGDIHFYA